MTISRMDADEIIERIRRGYQNLPQSKWPPFALTVWDDRNRYMEWVVAQIEAQTE